jgi:plastocyanin
VFENPPEEDSMAKWIALLCSCLAVSLVAAGCGGDDEEEGGGGGGEAQQQPAGGGGGEGVAVKMSESKFEPASVTVAKGGKVTWTNEDSVGHDVTKTGGPGAAFKSGDSGGMAAGDTFTQTFDTPGKVQYVCTVHANMKGTVTVE